MIKYMYQIYLIVKKNNYKIFFHFKTRNDSVGTTVLYEFKGYQNKWNELGYCTVHGKNKF